MRAPVGLGGWGPQGGASPDSPQGQSALKAVMGVGGCQPLGDPKSRVGQRAESGAHAPGAGAWGWEMGPPQGSGGGAPLQSWRGPAAGIGSWPAAGPTPQRRPCRPQLQGPSVSRLLCGAATGLGLYLHSHSTHPRSLASLLPARGSLAGAESLSSLSYLRGQGVHSPRCPQSQTGGDTERDPAVKAAWG